MTGAVDAIGLHARLNPRSFAIGELAGDRRWDYVALDDWVGRLQALLDARGCRRGDRVVMLARNSAAQVALHHACARAGVIYVPLNWRLAVAEVDALIDRADPVVALGAADAHPRAGAAPFEPFDAFLSAADAMPVAAPTPIDPDAPSLILFTSGTSGAPKGVMLSERNLRQVALNFGQVTAVGRDSVFLAESPMFHTIGLATNIRPAIEQGGGIWVSDGFEPARTCGWLADPAIGITHYVGVPQMIEGFRSIPGFRPEALARMTALVTGGAPHAPEAVAAWLDAGVTLVTGFGMSEAGTVFGMPVSHDVIRAHPGAVGIAAPAQQTRLVDAEGRDVAPGEAGELLVRGDSVMIGYWRAPEETARAIDADGWFATGDIARRDDRGFHWIVDRKKDMFISGGENIYPAEVEAALVGCPGIAECALVGVHDARWGEVGHLGIVASADDVTLESIHAWLDGRLARYKLPRRLTVLDALPRTATGKLRRTELRDMLTSSD